MSFPGLIIPAELFTEYFDMLDHRLLRLIFVLVFNGGVYVSMKFLVVCMVVVICLCIRGSDYVAQIAND